MRVQQQTLAVGHGGDGRDEAQAVDRVPPNGSTFVRHESTTRSTRYTERLRSLSFAWHLTHHGLSDASTSTGVDVTVVVGCGNESTGIGVTVAVGGGAVVCGNSDGTRDANA
jgi:hypothetical protein